MKNEKDRDLERELEMAEKYPYLSLMSQKRAITGKYYSLVKTEVTKERGKDDYGRYKITETGIIFKQFNTEEEMKDFHLGLAESVDDGFDFKELNSGRIPDFFRDDEVIDAVNLSE